MSFKYPVPLWNVLLYSNKRVLYLGNYGFSLESPKLSFVCLTIRTKVISSQDIIFSYRQTTISTIQTPCNIRLNFLQNIFLFEMFCFCFLAFSEHEKKTSSVSVHMKNRQQPRTETMEPVLVKHISCTKTVRHLFAVLACVCVQESIISRCGNRFCCRWQSSCTNEYFPSPLVFS